jgi:uncharacterized damage-inducible protein DinB
MAAKTVQQDMLSTKLIGLWEQAGRKLSDLAEAFPEARYESKPADGVRTFADVLRHVAFWNQYVAGTVRGDKTDDATNELSKTDYATKARILDALKLSIADAASAVGERLSGLDPQTAEMFVSFIQHTSEHYGQLVVYARLEGIVPPASRTS